MNSHMHVPLCFTLALSDSTRLIRFAMAFSTFLSQSRSLFFGKSSQQLHIAVGNKACDLDSIVSAITLSYFLFLTRNDERERGKCFLGLIPVPLEEFRLRYLSLLNSVLMVLTREN